MTPAGTVTEKANGNRFAEFMANLRRACSPQSLTRVFPYSAGAILAFVGGAYVLEFFARNQSLGMSDPIFGIPFRFTILLFGLLDLLVAVLCLFTSKKSLSLLLVLWLVAIALIYRIGLWQAGWLHPYPVVSIFTRGWGMGAWPAEAVLFMAGAYLLIGSAWILLISWRERRTKEFWKMSCPACGAHIRFAVQNLGQSITCPKCRASVTLRKPEENLRMSCYFCKEHIEFPAHAIGEKLKCPHCKMDITLKEPTKEPV